MRERGKADDSPGIWELDASDVPEVTELLAELATRRRRPRPRDPHRRGDGPGADDHPHHLPRGAPAPRRIRAPPRREGHGHGMTWFELIAEVRAQIDVDPTTGAGVAARPRARDERRGGVAAQGERHPRPSPASLSTSCPTISCASRRSWSARVPTSDRRSRSSTSARAGYSTEADLRRRRRPFRSRSA